MCRSIHTLFNMAPPATEADIHAASLQFMRKVAGFSRPSRVNATAFDEAVDDVAATVRRLLATLSTTAPARDRALEIERARARARVRAA